jgi:polar amino acid transport system substrate-binding protein
MRIARTSRLLAALAALTLAGPVAAQPAPLRAAFLAGNPVQARIDPVTKAVAGPAADLGAEIASKLGRKVEMIEARGADGVLSMVREGRADIGFVAFDPTRGEGVTFSPAYLMSLNAFVVRASSPIVSQADVDKPGVRLGAILGDAGGLFLQRTVKAATLQPVASADAGGPLLLDSTIDVLAANRQRLGDLYGQDSRMRILPGHFFEVPQAVVVRRDDAAMAALVSATVEAQLKSGAITASISRAGLTGAGPAPIPTAAR